MESKQAESSVFEPLPDGSLLTCLCRIRAEATLLGGERVQSHSGWCRLHAHGTYIQCGLIGTVRSNRSEAWLQMPTKQRELAFQ
jgi:hypothetical protein